MGADSKQSKTVLPSRDNNQYIMIALKGQKKKSAINGRWTKTEHDRFMKGLEKYGKDWVSVQKVVKTRTLTQVRSHAQKVFLKMDPTDVEALVGKQNEFEYRVSTPKPKLSEQQQLDYKSQVEETHEPRVLKKEPNLLDLFMLAIQEQSKEPSAQHETVICGQQNFVKGQQKTELADPRGSSDELGLHRTQRFYQLPETNHDRINECAQKMNLHQIYPIEIDLSHENQAA